MRQFPGYRADSCLKTGRKAGELAGQLFGPCLCSKGTAGKNGFVRA